MHHVCECRYDRTRPFSFLTRCRCTEGRQAFARVDQYLCG